MIRTSNDGGGGDDEGAIWRQTRRPAVAKTISVSLVPVYQYSPVETVETLCVCVPYRAHLECDVLQ